MRYLIICILLFYPVSALLAQDKHFFFLEFNANQIHYKMGSLNNDYLLDTNTFAPIFYGKNQTNTIRKGVDYNFVISYQPLNYMDFGVFLNYQTSSIWRSLYYENRPDPIIYPDSISFILKGTNKIEVNALSTGFSTYIYLNKFLKFGENNSKIINKIQLSVGFIGGIGFSTFSDRESVHYFNTSGNNAYVDQKILQFKAINFQGKTEVTVGYRIGQSFFSEIGLKSGYQFFKTSQVKNYAGSTLSFGSDINNPRKLQLDFSGYYYGVYIKVGK